MERGSLRLGCLIMAAGNGRRFGGNKLMEELGGEPVYQRAFRAVPVSYIYKVAVVTGYPEVMAAAAEHGFLAVENIQPEKGVSHTIRLGLAALGDCDGIIFQVADQPLLQRETVARLCERFLEAPEHIWALGHDGAKGNPCIFPGKYREELMALEGDRGGSAVIRAHREVLRLMEAPAEELMDIDTPEALEALRRELSKKICGPHQDFA